MPTSRYWSQKTVGWLLCSGFLKTWRFTFLRNLETSWAINKVLEWLFYMANAGSFWQNDFRNSKNPWIKMTCIMHSYTWELMDFNVFSQIILSIMKLEGFLQRKSELEGFCVRFVANYTQHANEFSPNFRFISATTFFQSFKLRTMLYRYFTSFHIWKIAWKIDIFC